jgi:hypothetical protein
MFDPLAAERDQGLQQLQRLLLRLAADLERGAVARELAAAERADRERPGPVLGGAALGRREPPAGDELSGVFGFDPRFERRRAQPAHHRRPPRTG